MKYSLKYSMEYAIDQKHYFELNRSNRARIEMIERGLRRRTTPLLNAKGAWASITFGTLVVIFLIAGI